MELILGLFISIMFMVFLIGLFLAVFSAVRGLLGD